jgi:hypothetical protein
VHIEGHDFIVTTWKTPNEWKWAYEGKTDTEGVYATQLKALAAAIKYIRATLPNKV